MPENDCDSEGTPLDAKDWEIAFAPYARNPGAALTLAFHFMALKSFLHGDPLGVQEALAALDRAVLVLFPHTQFHGISQELFLKVIQGTVTLDEEQTLRSLGVEF